ncbi:MAG: proline--tRNA ligase [Firmicutes bacterium]|nr:proline--tRNA ligase [Bacillota bacterium]
MLMSQLYAPTLRETPAEAELASHRYMLRAGLMRRSAAGIYTFLPLGLRVVRKVEAIIREEMNRIGGQEVLMPIVQPAELWQETGRWNDYGEEMFRLTDRHNRQFCLGPTHEELVTDLVRAEVRSYRQLPLRLYQIQNKYRDEIRPRFGLIRGREFIMKDMYSFDRDEAGLDESYWACYHAYERIFSRCGLDVRPVEADSGAIGGDVTHEFMVLADVGEAVVLYCSACDYAANVERAESGKVAQSEVPPKQLPMEEVATPGKTTIAEVTEFLGAAPQQCIKTMIYLADGEPVAALVRGDHELNEIKFQRVLGCASLELADTATIERVTGAPVGFAGPVGLRIPVVADHAATEVVNAVVGANKADYHIKNVNIGRDFQVTRTADIRVVVAGDPCPKCGAPLTSAYGIEVGQVFKLGTKYSAALKATFLDENGTEQPLIMGCYGIGVGRTVAAVIEQNHDEHGIAWPVAIAPYHVIVVPVTIKDEQQAKTAREIYEALQRADVEVVLDDRDERPGVKFKDADLIGFPIRITVGPKSLRKGMAEITLRKTGERMELPVDQITDYVVKTIKG